MMLQAVLMKSTSTRIHLAVMSAEVSLCGRLRENRWDEATERDILALSICAVCDKGRHAVLERLEHDRRVALDV